MLDLSYFKSLIHCIKYARIRVFTDISYRIRTESYGRIRGSGNPYSHIFFAVAMIGKWILPRKMYKKMYKKKILRKLSCIFLVRTLLTHFWSMFPFYTPWKHHKSKGFLIFWGGIKWEHWPEMVYWSSCYVFEYLL